MSVDWTRPVYRTDTGSKLEHMSTNGSGDRAFHGFADPEHVERGWLYYHQDGTPFRGAPEISNTPLDDGQETLTLFDD